MKYRKLGNSELEVSVLCMGCWGLAGDFHWGSQEEADSIATVHAALDAGINFFDTAEMYGQGRSDEVLGRALQGRRDRAIIASKVSPAHLARTDLIASCENSLRRLRTDYIDLFQIHWPNPEIPLEETWTALEHLQAQGKIRAIGVSNFGPIDLADLLRIGRPVSNQLPYSLLFRAIEFGIQERCRSENIGILCYSPLLHGLLSGKYTTTDSFPPTRARTRHFSPAWPHIRHREPGCEAETNAALTEIRRICDGLGEPMAHVALAWLLQRDGVTSVITGMRRPSQVFDNVRAAELTLSPATVRALEAATEAVKAKLGPNLDMWQTDSRAR
ncbi:MAG: aldo/keto reductase [Caldilineae bacterium]|nr:MAG: aldo/keto reductase [Caldilineae bacterium]